MPEKGNVSLDTIRKTTRLGQPLISAMSSAVVAPPPAFVRQSFVLSFPWIQRWFHFQLCPSLPYPDMYKAANPELPILPSKPERKECGNWGNHQQNFGERFIRFSAKQELGLKAGLVREEFYFQSWPLLPPICVSWQCMVLDSSRSSCPA